MLSTETIITFLTTATLLSFIPGPDNIFVLMQSATMGRRSGIFVTLGLCTGLIVHTLAVAMGVAVIFQVSIVAFTALKVVGAAYLLYLAWGAFKASSTQLAEGSKKSVSNFALYKRGIIMNITNPKVAIFFMAFLPQFTDPAAGSVSVQMIMLGGLFIVAALASFSLIAVLSGSLKQLLTSSRRSQEMLNKVAGCVFIGLAAKLVTSQK
ncbi:LysE family translocator [Spongorhabdus nitratireducens]